MHNTEELLNISADLKNACDQLTFSSPVKYVYNPLAYAWEPHAQYVRRYGAGAKRVIFLGMNPGPWGMTQTGVPFGEIQAVRDWLGVEAKVQRPADEHPKRPVTGFSCTRSEVSGRRMWGLFAEQFETPQAFFRDHYVVNYSPLLFLEEGGRNRTPDKLPGKEKEQLFEVCDHYLRKAVEMLQSTWVVGIGKFATERLEAALSNYDLNIHRIPHPSPANPHANRNWSELTLETLREAGIWR